ncbi:MAG: Type-F conjugative transfer system pilin assembly protein [Syntrophorhabdus sp. PtaU1.Bin153]|nr:MAG: Type-F conjugative transfer system pilin assembly protein [Syntrophorhabdus sp. PtaU1.Bin153]
MRMWLIALMVLLLALPYKALAKTVTIDTPSLCTKVEKVEGNRVDLAEPSQPCPAKGQGKANAEIKEELKDIQVYINGTYWKKVAMNSPVLSAEDIAETVEQSKKHSRTIDLPKNAHETEATRLAEHLSRYAESGEFQERIEAQKNRLYGQIYGGQENRHEATVKDPPGKRVGLSSRERIYLFISASVPIPTLRHYMKVINDLGEPNIKVVMRGFVGGAKFVKPTMAFLKEILFTDPECNPSRERCNTYRTQVIIDPLLFGKYRIEKVPAFIYAPSLSISDNQMSEGLSGGKASDHYLIYGDVSLEYALQLFLREQKSPGLEGLVAGCQGG